MNDVKTIYLSNGLKLLFIKKEGFVKSYCGIGCKYGGANVETIINGIKNKSPYGIAHFIEHKLFLMPDGSDAFQTFTKLNSQANAYTASDKTIYYFTNNDSIYNSLELLLNMYFNPYFPSWSVENEKGIINSEINMYFDNVGYRISQKCMSMLYPNDYYSYPIIGYTCDVLKITSDDLYASYKANYTIYNTVLCVVGDYKEEELVDFLENIFKKMDNAIVSNNNIEYGKTITSSDVLNPAIIYENVMQDEVNILLRIDEVTNLDAISCEKLLGVLEAVLSVSSKFYMELEKKHLFDNDLDFQVVTYKESSYITISAPSKKPKKLALEIINKLKNLTSDDIDEELVELYFKHLKSKSILALDSVEGIGENVLSLALENIDYNKGIDDILNLNYDSIKSSIKAINNAKMTYLIVKTKK